MRYGRTSPVYQINQEKANRELTSNKENDIKEVVLNKFPYNVGYRIHKSFSIHWY